MKQKRAKYWSWKIWVYTLRPFLKDFQYKTFRDLLCFQMALTWLIFELKRVLFCNQVLISPEIDWFSELRRQKRI